MSDTSLKKSRVLLRGENFLMDVDDTVKSMGFFTTVFVEAPDPDKAELRAVEVIRKDDRLRRCVLNERPDPPMLYAEGIDEVTRFDRPAHRSLGYTFYEHEQAPD